MAINPTERQVGIAEQLGVSRSAVSQIWNRLVDERSLRVRCLLDYYVLGFSILIGWVWSEEDAAAVEKFSRWLDANPFVIAKADALMSTKTDERVYFEVLLPLGRHHSNFLEKLARFEKRPYNLNIECEPVSTITEHLNLGLFNGNSWNFATDFRFEASIDAAREFSEILPANAPLDQGPSRGVSADIHATGACLESDYYSGAAQVYDYMLTLGLSPPSLRTIRRRLSDYRERLARPYIEIQNIGLGPSIVTCVNDLTRGSSVSRLLHTQGHLLPRARILSGSRLMAVDISLPSASDWFGLSISLSNMLKSDAQVSTFITEARIIRKGLKDILPYLF